MRREVCLCNYTLDPGARVPEKKHPEDAGYDVYANEATIINPGARAAVSTGVHFQPEPGWYIQVVPRSGLALKNGISVLNTPGTVDSNYTADVKVILVNHNVVPYQVNVGDRIAQIIFTPSYEAVLMQVDALNDSDRGLGGFGSTGK